MDIFIDIFIFRNRELHFSYLHIGTAQVILASQNGKTGTKRPYPNK